MEGPGLLDNSEKRHDKSENSYEVKPIGVIHSSVTNPEEAPLQGYEGAPEAWLEITEGTALGIKSIKVGDELIVLTWFHLARRDVLEIYPRREVNAPLKGVFSTRSPDRPNPIGLHRVSVLEMDGQRLRIGPIEAIDGTPVIDLKPVLALSNDQ
jgi:tRNA-Thr(GGU) m(6)t(6)A37 methyltransferase TsaA